ncbi:MAG: efflux RND transporter periplasmic adaptor subunit [Muribaculaceae bacterium]|nr:HlyD family efflux transporter periplasmic adaptor subunit [Bacteroides sp.]MDE6033158.1 efflux RND transporter periplasmic adaptor subunit [Muribaculaceae bacterium]MDE6262034.1 efflux RND transporter periplasmic adaptor subunit [Muribaculaceae bacterium]
MKKKNLLILITAGIIIVAIVATVLAGMHMNRRVDVIQGQIETSAYRVSSKVPGRVMKICVSEGDTVAAGDTLVILDTPDIEAKLAQAEAARQAAEALSTKANNGAQAEQIQGAYELWQKAKAGLEVAQKTYDRVNRLFEEGVMAAQKRDEAYANLKAMEATERAAKSQYEMAKNGARAEDKSAARAQVARADAAISEVNSYISEGVLTASAPGVVTEIYPSVGELVGTGAPLMNVSQLQDSWFTFSVREDKLPELGVGTEVTVYVPALDKEVPAKITRLKEIGSYAVWKATKALDQYDLKMFEVIARPDAENSLSGARAGMSAIIKE